MFNGFFDWLSSHKDSFLALAAMISPLMAFVAALVSYRAVVTGPRIQLKIAQQQFSLNERQLAIQSKQVELQEKQIMANLIGTYDQKWISEFRDTMAELFGALGQFNVQKIVRRQTEASGQGFMVAEMLGIQTKCSTLIEKVRFIFEDDYASYSSLIVKLRELLVLNDPEVNYAEREAEVHDMAIAVIKERRDRITAHIASTANLRTAMPLSPRGTVPSGQ
jgi:hypothetical protein